MLTDSEKNWLELRDASKHVCGNCFLEQLRQNNEYCEYAQHLEDYDQFVHFNPNRYGYCVNCEKNAGKDRSKGRLLDKWVSPEWYTLVEDEELEGIFTVEETPTGKSRREYRTTLRPDYQDAAEFEARVAAKLAAGWKVSEHLPCSKTKCSEFDCASCRLKIARFLVEEEMDADSEV